MQVLYTTNKVFFSLLIIKTHHIKKKIHPASVLSKHTSPVVHFFFYFIKEKNDNLFYLCKK